MAQTFRIDLTPLRTHKERYDVCVLLDKKGFDVSQHWITIDETHKTLDYIQAAWLYESEPRLPQLPEGIKAIRI